jgi:hypothetical protein
MKNDKPQSEAYNRLTLDGMKLSLPKLRALNTSMTDSENMITYIFPILRFHDRWRELSSDDLTYFFGTDRVSHNGYMMRADTVSTGFIPDGPLLPGYDFGDLSYEYLNKIAILCRSNDIELILIKMPSLHPFWYEQWDEQMIDFAAVNHLNYINTLSLIEDIGLDFDTDTYNGGFGLNVFGAEKLSVFIGNFLRDNYDVSDRKSNPELLAIWEKKSSAYHAMMQAQFADLELYDEIRTFTFTFS